MILRVVDVLFDSTDGLIVEVTIPPYLPTRLLLGKHILIAGCEYRVDQVKRDAVSVLLYISPATSTGVLIDLVF